MYIKPTIKIEKLDRIDILCSSAPEEYKSYIATDADDWEDEPIIDPDDDITW